MVSPVKFAHVRTRDYQKMVQFYETFLGSQSNYESPIFALLTYDEEHRIAITNIPTVCGKEK